MANSNGRISRPVDVMGDVAAVLGLSSGDVAYLCSNRHGRINPASKKKPIRYPQPEDLTTAQFKGTAADNNKGIYYGIRIGTSGNQNFKDLHNVGLSYQPPVPGTDWCRITDFNGYDHNARFNPQGTIASPLLKGNPHLPVTLYYSTANTTGVDIAEMVRSLDGTGGVETLGDFFPCVLLSEGGSSRSSFWARALLRAETGKPSKFQVDGGWLRDWLIPVTDFTTNGTVNASKSPATLLGNPGTVTMTVFFVRSITSTGFGLDLTKWSDVGGSLQKVNGFACPGAIGQQIPVKNMYEAGIVVNSVSIFKNMVLASLAWSNPKVGSTYTVSITVTESKGATVTSKSQQYTVPSNYASSIPAFSFNPLLSEAAQGTYTYSWSTYLGSTRTAGGSGVIKV